MVAPPLLGQAPEIKARNAPHTTYGRNQEHHDKEPEDEDGVGALRVEFQE